MPDYRRLFESAPGLYLVLACDLRIVAVSDAYLHATMTRRDDILGRGVFEVFPDNPDDTEASGTRNLSGSLQRVLRERVKDGLPIQKYDIRRPDSEGGGFEERFWSALNSPVFDDEGGLAYIIHRVEDVTEFVRLQRRGDEQQQLTEELRQRAGRMESEIYARVQEVAEYNARLRQANEELERLYARTKELDELKTQLFANVSHELRTPLALIVAPIDKLLAEGGLDQEVRVNLGVALRNARLLLRRVNDLLDASKLDAGQMNLRYAEVDLAHWVRMTCGYFESVAEQQHLRFVVDAAGGMPAQIDAEKVQRILYNLLANAIKFTPPQGVIRCTLRSAQDGAAARIEVADSGPGVQAAHRALIFERFRQAEGGGSRRYGGTGLGLAIAREFARLHSGELDVDAAPEGGALFVLSVPLRAPSDASVMPVVAPAGDDTLRAIAMAELGHVEPVAETAPDSMEADTRARILVVEDNLDLNRLICDSLRRAYRVEAAFDGARGLQAALANPPDLVISDVMMPGMTGDALLHALRSRAEFDDVPVVVLSAKADDDLRVSLLRSGAQDYVIKPFSVDELLARVHNLVDRKLAQERSRMLNMALQARQTEMEALATRLEVANKELESFSYSVSHDLRAPLRAIDGFARLLAQRAEARLDDEDRRLLGVVRNNSKAMGRLIDDLLQFSKMNRSDMQVGRTDMTELARTAWHMIAEDYAGEVEIGELPPAQVDRALLTQVWINLLSNAVKYSARTHTPRITVSGEPAEREHIYHVADNGAGFDMQYAHKLFGVFQRLHSAEEFAGTGIGLAIVARVVARHGGRVWAEGTPGAGATFHFALPVTCD